MTPDDLEAAVLAGDVDGVIRLLSGAPEPERAACGGRMAKLRKEYGDWPYNARTPATNDTTLLALLGTGTAAQIQGGRRMWRHASAGTVLRLRPPSLLDELVPWMLDHQGWRFVRALVREGAIARPTSDAYIYGMLDYSIDAPALVADDPDLLEHEVWRLFEVEGTGDHSLADHDKYTPDAKSWSRTMMDLAPVRLDRDRLLDAGLSALERDFPAFRAGWYSRFHKALGPTPAERVARVDAYLRLLRSPIPPTVTLAVAALTEIQRAGELDGARLIASIEPALGVRAAGTARQALRLVEGAARREPALSGAAARAASAALAHPSADVQAAAVALLEAVLPTDDEEARALVAARRRDVAASVLPRLDALLAGAPGSSAPAVSPAPLAPATAIATPALSSSAASDPWGALVPIEPVGSLADLVELLAGVLEREGPPEDLEVALDGVLRFTAPRTAEFGRLTKAIRVRSERLLAARRSQRIATLFAALIRSWVDATPPADVVPATATLAGYLARRVAEVAHAASGDRPTTLVALPSYAGGWIEPGELVARLAARQDASGGAEPDMPLDLPQALLRVLPVRRDAALAAASELRGEAGDAVVHALGGSGVVGPTAALWAAAARCRAPAEDDLEVAGVHPDLGPDGALAGRYTLGLAKGRWWGQELRLVDGATPREPRHDLPTDLLWRSSAQPAVDGKAGPLIDWVRIIWPQDRRSWFAASAAVLVVNLDWEEARWHDRRRLESLFEPWTPFGREAAILLAVALQAKEPGERGLAVDAAIAAVGGGRLPSDLVVQAFDEVATALEPQPPSKYPLTLFRPGRLAASLEAIARPSEAHRTWALEVAAGALTRMVATQEPAPVPVGQLTPLLRAIVELTASQGSEMPAFAMPALRAVSDGSGETARLATKLLAGASEAP